MFRPAFECAQHPKAGQNQQQVGKHCTMPLSSSNNTSKVKNWSNQLIIETSNVIIAEDVRRKVYFVYFQILLDDPFLKWLFMI